MKKLLPWLLLVCTLLLPGTALAKDWAILRLGIGGTLSESGDLQVTEVRTYRLDGDFSHLWQVIEYPQRSRLTNFRLAGYRQAETAEPGTYSLTSVSNGTRVDWYLPPGTTWATFALTYTLEGALRSHVDGTELYWDLVGDQWERGTGDVSIELILPAPPLDAWVEGTEAPLQLYGNLLILTFSELGAKQAVTVRALFPKDAITNTDRTDGKTLHAVRARAGREPDALSRAAQLAWTLTALAYGAWFYTTRVHRRTLGPLPEAERPVPLTPAALAALHRRPMTDGLMGTLVDLNRRGALEVERCGNGDWRFTRPEHELRLSLPDQIVLDAFFPNGRSEVDLSEWKELMSRSGPGYTKLSRWWESVGKGLPPHWFMPHNYWIYLVAAAGATVTLVTYPDPLRIPAGGTTLILLFLGLLQRRYTDEGYRQLALWERERERFTPAEVALALALGIKGVTAGFDLHWTDDAFPIILLTMGDSSTGDGGGGGGDGGGGGGAE